jgi:tetratricopeptide (TPR) repeat protein
MVAGGVIVPEETAPQVSPIRQGIAYWWYIWGQSCSYWGIRTAERAFFRAAVRLYSLAVAAWPAFAMGIYRRGLVRGRELGEHRAAIADLSAAIDLEPEWPEPYLQRGLFQRFHGDPHAAIDDLQRYLALGGEPYWRIEAERQISMLRAELAEAAGASGDA